ncbi:alpha/beta fold hydrolase [uncultured Mycobacterium sp.]|uniref:alpha/beta fold hydrolase n=1 Tax=uncultured Mycobacterium sp. TaxID=171292 RepID=UPI0035CBCDD3
MNPLTPIARPDWLPFERWPFDTAMLSTSAGRIAVTDVGSGPTLLFAHVGSWSFIWRDLLVDLSRQYRCITLDAPGSGLSSDPDAPVTLRGASDAIGAAIDSLDLHGITLIMHDVGGPAGLAAAADRAGRIAGLVALNALGWKPSGAALRAMIAVMGSAPARASGGVTGWLARLSASSFGAGRHWDATDRAIFLAGLNRSARRNTHRYIKALAQENDLLRRAEAALREELSGRPLLTVFGARNDPFGFGKRWKQLFPHAEQHIIAGGNHYPMGDDPHGVAEWIRHWHTAEVSSGRIPQGRNQTR